MYKIIRCVVIISVVLLPLVFRKQIRTNKIMLFAFVGGIADLLFAVCEPD